MLRAIYGRHVVESYTAFSDQRRKYSYLPYTLQSVLGDDTEVESLISFQS